MHQLKSGLPPHRKFRAKSAARERQRRLLNLSLGHRPRNSVIHIRSAESASQFSWFSIPNIPLVEINAVSVQQLAIFLLKRASAMVFVLPVNVSEHRIELTRAH